MEARRLPRAQGAAFLGLGSRDGDVFARIAGDELVLHGLLHDLRELGMDLVELALAVESLLACLGVGPLDVEGFQRTEALVAEQDLDMGDLGLLALVGELGAHRALPELVEEVRVLPDGLGGLADDGRSAVELAPVLLHRLAELSLTPPLGLALAVEGPLRGAYVLAVLVLPYAEAVAVHAGPDLPVLAFTCGASFFQCLLSLGVLGSNSRLRLACESPQSFRVPSVTVIWTPIKTLRVQKGSKTCIRS